MNASQVLMITIIFKYVSCNGCHGATQIHNPMDELEKRDSGKEAARSLSWSPRGTRGEEDDQKGVRTSWMPATG